MIRRANPPFVTLSRQRSLVYLYSSAEIRVWCYEPVLRFGGSASRESLNCRIYGWQIKLATDCRASVLATAWARRASNSLIEYTPCLSDGMRVALCQPWLSIKIWIELEVHGCYAVVSNYYCLRQCWPRGSFFSRSTGAPMPLHRAQLRLRSDPRAARHIDQMRPASARRIGAFLGRRSIHMYGRSSRPGCSGCSQPFWRRHDDTISASFQV
jgi:hypothetical protein